jgi:hypothetical protein
MVVDRLAALLDLPQKNLYRKERQRLVDAMDPCRSVSSLLRAFLVYNTGMD